MKSFNLALLTAMASASDYSITRTLGEPIQYWLIQNTTTRPSEQQWYMNVQSVYDNDTGFEWIEIEHVLIDSIKQTDLISFELAFTSFLDPYTDRINKIAMDSGLCNLAINSADTRFWLQTTTDQHYKCTDQACITAAPTSTADTTNDWKAGVNWEVDDDEDNPFCTPHATDTATFKCSQIKCKYRRKMDTEDAQDF